MDTKLELQGQTKAGKKDKHQMSKQTGQVEPSKLMDSQDMPSCQITKNAKEPQADKADHTHKHGSIPRTWDQIHSQIIQHTHHTKAKPKVSSPDIVQSCNYRYQPKYRPLSNSESPDNNPYYCFFRTSANNNSHYCQYYPNRIHTIF